MQVTITRFRQDLFRLADTAMAGERVQFVYKGVVFQVLPEGKQPDKLDRLVGQPTLAPSSDADLEMQAKWLEDWSAM